MKEIKLTRENAIQMKESGIESLVSLAKENYPELFEEKFQEKNIDHCILTDEKETFFDKSGVLVTCELSMYYGCYGTLKEEIAYVKLGLRMRSFCRWANEKDEFVPEYISSTHLKYGLIIHLKEVHIADRYTYDDNLFNCSFKTKERAEEFLGIFREDIERVFKLNDNRIERKI